MTDEAEALKPCPREPDEAMIVAGQESSPGTLNLMSAQECRETWIAMHDAAPKSLEIPREIAALRDRLQAAEGLARSIEGVMHYVIDVPDTPEIVNALAEYRKLAPKS